MTIDITKNYRTRDGREVRIYAVDGVGTFSVHGAIKVEGWFVPAQWAADGRASVSSHLLDEPKDLIEVRPRIKREVWVNVYGLYNDALQISTNKAIADSIAGCGRLACIPITIDCAEGDGL
jgi:hypothetical protein